MIHNRLAVNVFKFEYINTLYLSRSILKLPKAQNTLSMVSITLNHLRYTASVPQKKKKEKVDQSDNIGTLNKV